MPARKSDKNLIYLYTLFDLRKLLGQELNSLFLI